MLGRILPQFVRGSCRALVSRLPVYTVPVRFATKETIEELKEYIVIDKTIPLNLYDGEGEQKHVIIATELDDIDVISIIKDLNMEVLLDVVQNPPQFASLPADRSGLLKVSELCQLSNADFKLLVPNIMMRNRLKEHLRNLIGSVIVADDPSTNIATNTAKSETSAATETNMASIKPLIVPELLPGIASAVIVEWKVKIGEHFIRGQALCEIDMDLAVVDLEADEPGHISEIVVETGIPFKAGDVLAIQTYHE